MFLQYTRSYDGNTMIEDAQPSWAVTCRDSAGDFWTLLDGFGRKEDAIIAMRYLATETNARQVENMPLDEASDFLDAHADQWMKEVCERLRW